MSVTATVLLDVTDLSGVFCVADSGVLQDDPAYKEYQDQYN